ncbi:MAG: response regulator transcription factor [Clostridia bacterium]|nr:response regulator transcription factor [Clostridia bacterium]
MYTCLVCDDDKDIVSAIKIYLESEGYGVICAYNGKEAVDILKERESEIQIVLLDIMMPVMDGVEAIRKIREFSGVPVIFLSAKSEDTDKILGLNLGADDYITKPFNPLELQARVKSNVRRYTMFGANVVEDTKSDNKLVNGGIEMDDATKVVVVDGNVINLTKTEYNILKCFLENTGIVLSPDTIYEKVWNDTAVYGCDNTVAVHIRHLREKLEINPSEPRYLKVVWGYGYKMEKIG